uniref:hypothetical protein n=1 Tax=Microbacterium proteolyticum TaxID=1572644 RepID=UPI0024164C27|nr:hypothetical protein [Microbacterium proteolyticum]
MSLGEQIARVAASIPSVRSETAVFVRMEGAYAVVNVGLSTIRVANVGWVPPVAGMTVQVEWRDGFPVVSGPARALNPVGVITGAGTPRATVQVDGVDYLLFIRAGYTPTLGDTVTVNWQTGIIEGAITGQDAPETPPEAGNVPQPFRELVVKAANSGRFQTSWWGPEPWASNNNRGIWTYENRIRETLRDANVTRIEINLSLVESLGNASIGLHNYGSIPGGFPDIHDGYPMPARSGWVELPQWWGNWLRDNVGGIGVWAPGGGYNRWQAVRFDSWSGALRFAGTM